MHAGDQILTVHMRGTGLRIKNKDEKRGEKVMGQSRKAMKTLFLLLLVAVCVCLCTASEAEAEENLLLKFQPIHTIIWI